MRVFEELVRKAIQSTHSHMELQNDLLGLEFTYLEVFGRKKFQLTPS
jgi:hypothetical protein